MGKDSVTQDFATNVWRMKQLGFNAIRLPFRFTDFEVDPIPVKHECQVAPAVSHPSSSAQMLHRSIRTGSSAAGGISFLCGIQPYSCCTIVIISVVHCTV